jgi:hypothetical protein
MERLPADAADAVRRAGAEQLSAPARAWLDARLARWGLLRPAHNLGGIRCSVPHSHDAGDRRCVLVVAPEGPRRLAAFSSLAEGAAALVGAAQRAGATPGVPVDLLEGFRSVHVRGTASPEDSSRRMRELTAEWEALETAGAVDPAWLRFRDAWRDGGGEALAGELPSQEERANIARRALVLAGMPPVAGLSDAALKEFFYLEQRAHRYQEWVFANCGNKRSKDAPPCKLTDSQKKNFSDFAARWIDYAGTVNRWAVNKGELFGSSVDDNSIEGWRGEFEQWNAVLHAAGFEADLTAATPAPKPPPYVPPASTVDTIAQLKPYAMAAAGVAGLVAAASLARSVANLFGGRS